MQKAVEKDMQSNDNKEPGEKLTMERKINKLLKNIDKVKSIFHCDTNLFALGTFASPKAKIPTCWHLLRQVTPSLKFALPPKPTPDASQWNIGGLGSPK